MGQRHGHLHPRRGCSAGLRPRGGRGDGRDQRAHPGARGRLLLRGWDASLFGDLHGYGPDGIRFYTVVDLARQAETYGFSHAWTFDSHVLWQEPYVIYSQILAQTHRMVVGPMVTNPGTRDWTVTASVVATLNDMFGDRTICGIGQGDSALRVLGKPPCTLATLAEAIGVIRGLTRGEEVAYNGQAQRFPWAKPSRFDVVVAAPAYVGEVADLVARYGADSELVPQALTDYTKGREGYDYAEHGRATSSHVDFVPDGIVDRFCILGPLEAPPGAA